MPQFLSNESFDIPNLSFAAVNFILTVWLKSLMEISHLSYDDAIKALVELVNEVLQHKYIDKKQLYETEHMTDNQVVFLCML